MSSFVLKVIACIAMVCDHIRYVVPNTNNIVTIALGRISYPLFAFLLTEGYSHTKDLKKYYKRIIIFALISQIPFMMFRNLCIGVWQLLNIMFTLLFGLIAINIYDKYKNKFVCILLTFGIIILSRIIIVDYNWWGILTVFLFYVFRNNKFLLAILFVAITFIYYFLRTGISMFSNMLIMEYMIFTFSSLIFIFLYNGKEGRKLKYFFYWFYPIHLLIFALLKIFVL